MDEAIRVAELFAGVGGFRLGLQAAGGFKTVWANQWEPNGSEPRQFAARCYERHFGEVDNRDISTVDATEIPAFDMLVGGFPCQDYSVAKALGRAGGIEGKKGVLWWEIRRILEARRPKYLLLENVDRLLKSPASQRGRDFAIMLRCLADLGYSVEWEVINAAEFGFPQRRRRIYIYGELDYGRMIYHGPIWRAFSVELLSAPVTFEIKGDISEVSDTFGLGKKTSPFCTYGTMYDGTVTTYMCSPGRAYPTATLGSVLVPDDKVPENFIVKDKDLSQWKYLKGGKRIDRIARNGHPYTYSEGPIAFPDNPDAPSRTILTGEGGSTPSRFKHIIRYRDGYRRLVPEELEALQGFPVGWTATGMTDIQRAFCMGNALVVGIPERIGREITKGGASGYRAS